MEEIDKYYLPERKVKTEVHTSPSGKYELVIDTYNTSKITGKNTRDYTRGSVFNKGTLDLVGSIKRNCSKFPFLFFTSENGDEYLVLGKLYTRQTILNCQSKEIYDNSTNLEVSDFCWLGMYQLDKNTVIVLGCYRGGCYEYKFFDFTKLSSGWPELSVDQSSIDKGYLDHNNTKASMTNGIFTVYHMVDIDYLEDENYKDNFINQSDVDNSNIIAQFCRKGNAIKLVSVKLSESYSIIERQKDVDREVEKERVNQLKLSNVVYRYFVDTLKRLNMGVQEYTFQGSDKLNASIRNGKNLGCNVEFEPIGVINLECWCCVNTSVNKPKSFRGTFPQSEENINKIIDKIIELIGGE